MATALPRIGETVVAPALIHGIGIVAVKGIVLNADAHFVEIQSDALTLWVTPEAVNAKQLPSYLSSLNI
jgi:hypothetical protein